MTKLPFSDFPLFQQILFLAIPTLACIALLAVCGIMLRLVLLLLTNPAKAREFANWLAMILPFLFDRKLFKKLKLTAIKKERRYSA